MMQVKSGRKFNIGGIGARISDLAMTFPNSAAVAIEAFGQQEAKRYKSQHTSAQRGNPAKTATDKAPPSRDCLENRGLFESRKFFKSRKFLRERKAPRP